MRKLEIFTDGACSGNPGAAAIGVVIKSGGATIKTIAKSIGEATNNIAEYTAVIYALQEALALGATDVDLYTDSELLFKQMNGQYKIKHPRIRLLADQIKHLMQGFDHIRFAHVRRERNSEADKLAKQAIRHNEQTGVVASASRLSSPES